MALPELISSVLLLFSLLMVKHMFADFYLQTPKMLSGRCQEWHMGRAMHAGVHVLGSILVFLIMGAPLAFIAIVVALEWVVHFNIDFGKASYSERKELNPTQGAFWRAVGLDQCLHNLTYVAMTWAWVTYAA